MIPQSRVLGIKAAIHTGKRRYLSCFSNSPPSGCLIRKSTKKSSKNFKKTIDSPFAVGGILQLKLRNRKHLAEIETNLNQRKQTTNKTHFKGGNNYGR